MNFDQVHFNALTDCDKWRAYRDASAKVGECPDCAVYQEGCEDAPEDLQGYRDDRMSASISGAAHLFVEQANLRSDLARYRAALEWYADPNNWIGGQPVTGFKQLSKRESEYYPDDGRKAREALESTK